MINLHIDLKGNQADCSAEVKLEGLARCWRALVKTTGHPNIQELHVYYRLGDFLRTLFISEIELQFFSPLLSVIKHKALTLLAEEAPITIDII
jgi:hypothetical protein